MQESGNKIGEGISLREAGVQEENGAGILEWKLVLQTFSLNGKSVVILNVL